VSVLERPEKCGDVVGEEERFVALDVDVNVGVVELDYGVEAVGAAREIGRRELDGDVEAMAEVGDFFGVGGYEDLVELRAGACSFDYPREEWATGDLAKEFAGKASRGEAGGDDSEDAMGVGHGVDRAGAGQEEGAIPFGNDKS